MIRVRYEMWTPELAIEKVAILAAGGGCEAADKARGDADGTLAAAAVKVDSLYRIPRENHNLMAPNAAIAACPDLGTIRARRAVGTCSAGRIVNPLGARSQCIGGMVDAIGIALIEQTVLDPRVGRPVNASTADYFMPVNLDIGELEAVFVSE
jgi:xanthine dehydrogenase YagR molybdenum-binding subunit